MPNYHFGVDIISRGKGQSLACRLNYITGKRMRDSYTEKTYYRRRDDVRHYEVFAPPDAPEEFRNMQMLCDKIEQAEIRYDARTAREFKCSLPNEVTLEQQIRIACDFVEKNFVSKGLCAVAAIHAGLNPDDLAKNNPHAHILITTRSAGPDGFSVKKDREHDQRRYVYIWRSGWAREVNLAYERAGLDIRVSHESLEVQGVYNREPVPHLTLADWQKERRGIRTEAGDKRRAIKARNAERERQMERRREWSLERSR